MRMGGHQGRGCGDSKDVGTPKMGVQGCHGWGFGDTKDVGTARMGVWGQQ